MNEKIEFVVFGVVLILLLTVMPINANGDNLQDAFKYAEKTLFPLDGICGVSYTEDPPRIIVFVEDEKYKDMVPDDIKGFKTEIIVSGGFGALNEPPLKVILKVREIFHMGLYTIKVSVRNLGNKRLSLGIPPAKGGFIVYNESGEEIYREPKTIPPSLTRLVLWPHQRKTLYKSIWNMDLMEPSEKYTIYGFIFGYEYNGVRYPSIESSPITIYP